jgi:hypothetical protein
MQIAVTALVGGRQLQIGTNADPTVAEAVATSWARWIGCRAAVMRPVGAPPILVVRPSTIAPLPPAPSAV